MSDIESIVGRYVNITVDGRAYRIFYEEAGSGIPLFCLHTAGADSRQFRHMLNDPDLTAKYHVVAFDLPWHGRSTPPQQWWEDRYLLTADHYMGDHQGHVGIDWSATSDRGGMFHGWRDRAASRLRSSR